VRILEILTAPGFLEFVTSERQGHA
jgi:hypothetical protein